MHHEKVDIFAKKQKWGYTNENSEDEWASENHNKTAKTGDGNSSYKTKNIAAVAVKMSDRASSKGEINLKIIVWDLKPSWTQRVSQQRTWSVM